jgi:hypothetical protein
MGDFLEEVMNAEAIPQGGLGYDLQRLREDLAYEENESGKNLNVLRKRAAQVLKGLILADGIPDGARLSGGTIFFNWGSQFELGVDEKLLTCPYPNTRI